MNISVLWSGLNLIRGNVKRAKERDAKQKKQLLEKKRNYDKEPGITREYRKVGNRAYARVREGHTGNELWRSRSLHPGGIEFSCQACECKTMEEFIELVAREI